PRPCRTGFDIHMHGPLLPSTTSTLLFSATSSTASKYLTPGLSPAEPPLGAKTYTCGFLLATWRDSNGPTPDIVPLSRYIFPVSNRIPILFSNDGFHKS